MGREGNKIDPELILALLQKQGDLKRGECLFNFQPIYPHILCDLKYYKGAKCNCIFFLY